MALRELIVTTPEDHEIFWDSVYKAHRDETSVTVLVQAAPNDLTTRSGHVERARDFAFTVWGLSNEPVRLANIRKDDGTEGYVQVSGGKLVITMVEG
jgi:hypothetical protein